MSAQREKATPHPACTCGCHLYTSEQPTGRRSVWSVPFVWLVRAYQLLLSPLLPPTCRYYPSCSAYSITALRRYGPLRGTWMTVKRLARCHPWAAGGVDHVPGPDPCHPSRPSATATCRHCTLEPEDSKDATPDRVTANP